MELKSKIKFV